MSRKDYQAVADALSHQKTLAAELHQGQYEQPAKEAALEALQRTTEDLAGIFARDNGRFDRGRFMEAAR